MIRRPPSPPSAARWLAVFLGLPAAAHATVPTPLPEPDTLALLGVALVAMALGWVRGRKK